MVLIEGGEREGLQTFLNGGAVLQTRGLGGEFGGVSVRVLAHVYGHHNVLHRGGLLLRRQQLVLERTRKRLNVGQKLGARQRKAIY